MLYLILFLIATIIALVTAKLWQLPWNFFPENAPPPLLPIILLLVFIGGGLMVVDGYYVERGMAQKKWPTVTGKIIKAEVIEGATYIPNVKYTYVYSENEYMGQSDMQVPYFGMKSSRREVAYITVLECKKHPAITVYVNPQDAAHSTLKPGPRWDQFTKLSLGTVLYLVGMSGIFSRRKITKFTGETSA